MMRLPSAVASVALSSVGAHRRHELPFSLRRRMRSEGGVRVSWWVGPECGGTAPPVMSDAGACYVIRGSEAWVDTPRRYV